MDYNGDHQDWNDDNKTKKETHTRGFESSTLIRNLSPLLESKFNFSNNHKKNYQGNNHKAKQKRKRHNCCHQQYNHKSYIDQELVPSPRK